MRFQKVFGIAVLFSALPLASCKEIQMDLTQLETYVFFVVDARVQVSVPHGYGSLHSRPQTILELGELGTGPGTSLFTVNYDVPAEFRIGALHVEMYAARYYEAALGHSDARARFWAQHQINSAKSEELCNQPGAQCDGKPAAPIQVEIAGKSWWMIQDAEGPGPMGRIYYLASERGFYIALRFEFDHTKAENARWLAMAETATQRILESVTVAKFE